MTRRTAKERAPELHAMDLHVGHRIRIRRTLLAMSQEKLGEHIGLTFQQVQKYERGANRVSASRLLELSGVLDVPVAFFYDETDPVHAPAILTGFEEMRRENIESDPLRRREALELAGAYYDIGDTATRRRLFDLAKSLAAEVDNNPRRSQSQGLRPPRGDGSVRSALSALLAVVEIADTGWIDDDQHQAAKKNARRALDAGRRRPT